MSRERPAAGLPLTGERTLPGIPEENYWFQRHVAAYRLARELVRGRVVDAGSGEGYGAAILAGAARVVGLDLDPAAVAHAARRYPEARFARADLCRLPLAEESVDAVVALQVVEHLWCPEAFLEACRAALRPDGVLIVSTPNRATFPAGLNPTHTHEYDEADLRGLLGRWFREVEVVATAHGRRLSLLDRLLGEPVQHRLVRRPYREQAWWARAALRSARSGWFRIVAEADTGLDLLAVCRRPRSDTRMGA